MFFIYDNLSASIIGATVLFILMAMQVRMMENNVQQTATYATKTQSLEFADWLEDDLLRIGENIKQGEEIFCNPDQDGDRTEEFTFFRDSLLTVDDTLRVATQYALVATGTRDVEGETVQLYEAARLQKIEPKENGVPPFTCASRASIVWDVTGQSPALLQNFQVEMLDKDGQPVSDPATKVQNDPSAVRQTHIKFAMISPFRTDRSSLRAMHWGASLLLRND